MTTSQARVIWDRLRQPSEGYIDAQARIEKERPLTAQEVEAAEVIWQDFVDAMKRLARFGKG